MNKVSCEIIQDLLPLYCDDACSAESRQMVQAHLQSCETCREELRLMGLPIPVPENRHEVEAAHAAARAWKKNKRTAFRMGIILAALLVLLSAVLICGTHYAHSAAGDDTVGLQVLLESYGNMEGIGIDRIVQKGDYLAVSGQDLDGKWHLGIYTRDHIFSQRWRICGALNKVRSGNLANWNYETSDGGTILVCFGAELSESISGYTFTNNGVTYICTVEEQAVLDFFFIPDAYDSRTHLEPIWR